MGNDIATEAVEGANLTAELDARRKQDEEALAKRRKEEDAQLRANLQSKGATQKEARLAVKELEKKRQQEDALAEKMAEQERQDVLSQSATKELQGRCLAEEREVAATPVEEVRQFEIYRVKITDKDGKSGLQPGSLPPHPVFLKGVVKGSWAERSGITIGDELIEVGGKQVNLMTKDELYAVMKKRPLEFVLKRFTEAADEKEMANAKRDAVAMKQATNMLE